MSLLHELSQEELWHSYLTYKKQSRYVSPDEISEMENFITKKRYLEITEKMTDEDYEFSIPQKMLINKKYTSKKRILYSFSREDSFVLKLLNHLLVKYDYLFLDSCYAFRRDTNIKNVISKLNNIADLSKKYIIKIDIRNYSNSIPVEKLIPFINHAFCDDPELASFFIRLFCRNMCTYRGDILHEPTGILPGTPITGFFANLYLSDIDEYFSSKDVSYFRYSDDILIFVNSSEEQESYTNLLLSIFQEKGLSVNPEKLILTAPGEKWEYLGFSYENGVFDLSENIIQKTKMKIRRYARYLYKYKRSFENMSYEEVVKIFLYRFNSLFFDSSERHDFCWKRWYFSIINTSESLKEIDTYMQQYIRYLYSGRHYKGNYKITYEKIKKMGYRSLVNEYYKYLETEND